MKRVLLICYFFPPVSNMGSHRMLRFVRHLREYNWEPVVLTGESPGWAETDAQLLAEVPAEVQVIRVGGLDLTTAWRKLERRAPASTAGTVARATRAPTQGLTTFLNRWVMVPDKYFPWIKPATSAALAAIARQPVDAIYSTSDPLTDHLVGRRLARRTGLPWVAEFRDLWLGSPYFARAHPTALHRAWHARLERQVVEESSLVVGLSEGIRSYFRQTYPHREAAVLYNCFEDDDRTVAGETVFTILYTGALYSSRSPVPFFAGLSQFVRAAGLDPERVRAVFLGGSPDLDLAGLARQHGTAAYVRFEGKVPHATALERMRRASVLLTIQSPEDDVHVPGKVFEYIGSRRPILAIAQPCEVARIVSDQQLGWVARPEPADVARVLAVIYEQWQRHGHAGLAVAAADRFGVRHRTRELATLLDSVSTR